MLELGVEKKLVVEDLAAGERELGQDRRLALDLNGKFPAWQESVGTIEDGEKLRCLEPVIGVVCDPHLEQATAVRVALAAAVEEGLGEMSDFGDVEMDGHGIAIRRGEGDSVVGVAAEEFEEFACLHG
jgi:hypothetical protein